MSGNSIILFLIGFPMIGGVISYLIGRYHKKARNYVADIIVIIEFLAMIVWCWEVVASNTTLTFQWDGFAGKGLYFVMDGFRYIYGSIVACMWMITTIFSREYFKHCHNRNRYYFFSLLTLGATMGVFLSADLFTAFIFFEVMSLASYVWVVHEEEPESMRAGQTYLAFSIIGGLVMLMGLFLLQYSLGTLEISMLLEKASLIENKNMLYVAGACIFAGFGAKAGVFPLHVWLPKSYTVAPAPITALLSSVLTKAGIFGILVVSCYLFYGDQTWGAFVLLIGVITMFVGAILALCAVNLKKIVACSSMSQIGFIVTGIGMQGMLGEMNGLAVRGTFLHMINHSLIKIILFIIAGIVVMNIHKLDLNEIQGFGRKKPLLHFAFLMGGLGITGVPLLNGYISKTLLHESIVEYISYVKEGVLTIGIMPLEMVQGIEYIFLFSGGMTVAYILKIYICLFIKKNANRQVQEEFDKRSENYISIETKVVLFISAMIVPIMGFFPRLIMDGLADIGQGFMNGNSLEHEVHYFAIHNLGGAILSISIGIILYILVVCLLLTKKDDKGVRRYFDGCPKWIDMEEYIYRPLIIYILPLIGATISKIADSMIDFIVVLLRKTIYRDRKIPQELPEGNSVTHLLGHILDKIRKTKNKIGSTQSKNAVSYVHRIAVLREEFMENNTIIGRSLSFGLFMFSLGLFVTLIYMLFL